MLAAPTTVRKILKTHIELKIRGIITKPIFQTNSLKFPKKLHEAGATLQSMNATLHLANATLQSSNSTL